jgi:protoporphyrinogen oxidase
LSTTGATIDVAARIRKLNIIKKDETFIFKPKGTKKYNQVMVTIRLERNAMTLDKKNNVAKKISTKFFGRVKNATPVVTTSPVAPAN